jgi:hypothetical protein
MAFMNKLPYSFEKPDAVIFSTQRSGTHFLQACLASHPRFHARGESTLKYWKFLLDPAQWEGFGDRDYQFRNKPGKFNIAIVMYSYIETFERLCGRLNTLPVIHLLRNPVNVAKSLIQLEANRTCYTHYPRLHHLGQTALPPAPVTEEGLEQRAQSIRQKQVFFTRELADFERVLTLTYEDLTGDQQVNHLEERHATRILNFLGLESAKLTNTLKKSATPAAQNLPAANRV